MTWRVTKTTMAATSMKTIVAAKERGEQAADSMPAGASAAESGAGPDDESGDYGGETFRGKHHRGGIIETGDGRE